MMWKRLFESIALKGGNENKYTIKNYNNHGIDALNKNVIDQRIKVFNKNHKRSVKREPALIVNLTSFPQRIHEVHYTIYSILTQSIQPDHVILWLSEEEFPRGWVDLPETLTQFTEAGLQIRWCSNLRSYKKLIPALHTYPDAVLVTADDDVFYPSCWLEELYVEYMNHGDRFVYAHRAHRIKLNGSGVEKYSAWEKDISYTEPSFLNLATGVGGVLYPPHSLSNHVMDIADFMTLSPMSDDLWFWAMGVMNGTRTRITKNRRKLVYINPERELRLNGEPTLSQENVVNSANDWQMRNILDRFNIMEILYNDK